MLELPQKFEQGADIVQAVRLDAPTHGLVQARTSQPFYRLMTKIGSIDIQGGSADFRLFSRRVVEVFANGLRERNPFIRGLTSWVGFTVAYVGFICRDRVAGRVQVPRAHPGGVRHHRHHVLLEDADPGRRAASAW